MGACEYGHFYKNPTDERILLKQFEGVTRFSYGYLVKKIFGHDYLKELVPQFFPVGQYHEIPPFSKSALIEIYQNATPWNTNFSTCDKDFLGFVNIGGPDFDDIDLTSCKWYIHVKEDESIEMVIREFNDTGHLTKEKIFPCDVEAEQPY